jgi:kumamolisin
MTYRWMLPAFLFIGFALDVHGANTDGGRMLLPGSIREIPAVGAVPATGQHEAVILRRALSPSENAGTIEFEVALQMRNFPELQQRLSRGERIATAEMAAQYFPLEADYQAVADWITSQGLTIMLRDPNRLAIFASGPVGLVSQAFQATFARVSFENTEYTSAISAPGVPAALAPVILGVNGLQPHIRAHKHAQLQLVQPNLTPSIAPPFLPSEIAHAYNADTLIQTGSGQEIGIVIDTFPATSDLTVFWSDCGVGQSLGNIEFVQVVSGTLPAPSGEETLDVEWSSAIATGAKVRVYATKDLSTVHIDEAYARIVSDLPSQPDLHQVSLSYGLGETYTTASQVQTDDNYFAELASAGVTVVVSSGDGGSSPGTSGQDHSGPVQVETPASDPNVTAVGGTTLDVDASTGNVTSETAWANGGGGISIYFNRPVWQTGTGVPSGTTRLVPDVACAADPNTGGFLILNGAEYIVGGTSWSSPTWAGFCALINQARANAGLGSLGLLGPQIYPLLGSANFRDITSGSNGSSGVYNAGVGYDLCTGIGVPEVVNLLQTLVTPPPMNIPVMPAWALGVLALFIFSSAAWLLPWKRLGHSTSFFAKVSKGRPNG